MKLEKPWQFGIKQTITLCYKTYDVNAAILLAEDLPVKDLAIADLNIDMGPMCKRTFRSFLEHMKSVLEADLSYPIILNQDGAVIDGRHRIARAIIEGHETIKAKRFIVDPPACYTEED